MNGYIAEPGYKLLFVFVFFKAHERVENSASTVGDMSVHYTWDQLPSYQKREVSSDQTGKEKQPDGRRPGPQVSSLTCKRIAVCGLLTSSGHCRG